MEVGILENYLKIKVLKIKFKIKFWRIISKMEALKIKFENWNFGKLFEYGNFKIKFENGIS